MNIVYTALRSIQAGHTSGTDYAIIVDLRSADRVPESTGSQLTSLSGYTVTTVHNLAVSYIVTTQLISTLTTPSLSDMREFLDSVKAGEIFSSDVSGTVTNYKLKNFRTPYSESREDQAYFRYSFTFVEA